MDNKEITYFAETDFRNKKTPFGIKTSDRARHMYIIGKTGMGKSTLLENLVVQDIKNGNGLAFIDPHGGSAEKLLDYVPKERIKDVIYFAPHDVDYPVSFNVMEDVGKDQRHLVANGLMASFKKIWPDVWSARMEYISMNIILALLEYPGSTLLGINRMLSDKDYRKKVVDNVSDPSVKSFWVNEFAKYSDKIMVEAGASIQNKFGQFSSNPLIRNIIGQKKSSFDLRKMMDNKKIFIANLSKGRMGEINTNLIGGMLITKIYLAAMSRASASSDDLKKLPNFYCYVDEFQSFVNDSFADILSEARKYKLNLTIAHQYIEQMPETVRNAVFGNVGTTIAFRVGPFDAEVLEKIFAPKFTAEDIVNLGFAQVYLTLMIDGVGSQPFSAKTMPPISLPEVRYREEIIESSRAVYAKPRVEVEAEIKKWHEADPGAGTSVGSSSAEKSGGFGAKEGSREFPPRKPAAPTWTDKPHTSQTSPARPYLGSKPQIVAKTIHTPTATVVTAASIRPPAEPVPMRAPAPRVIPPATTRSEQVKKPEPAVSIPMPKVSLNALRTSPPTSSPVDTKATGKNIGNLKNVLSNALGSKNKGFEIHRTPAKKESADEEPREKIIREEIVEEKKVEPIKQPSAPHKEEPKIKEVPEDVLRKVLDTGEGGKS